MIRMQTSSVCMLLWEGDKGLCAWHARCGNTCGLSMPMAPMPAPIAPGRPGPSAPPACAARNELLQGRSDLLNTLVGFAHQVPLPHPNTWHLAEPGVGAPHACMHIS